LSDVDRQQSLLQEYVDANNGLLQEGTEDSYTPVPEINKVLVIPEKKMELLFK
jgi:hypothetical protein